MPVICGQNSGEHIYVDFNGDSDIQIIIDTSAAISLARNWNLKIAQIGCDCPTRGNLFKVLKLSTRYIRTMQYFVCCIIGIDILKNKTANFESCQATL